MQQEAGFGRDESNAMFILHLGSFDYWNQVPILLLRLEELIVSQYQWHLGLVSFIGPLFGELQDWRKKRSLTFGPHFASQ